MSNFCINCRYIGTNYAREWEKYRCFAPENIAGVNLVTGATTYKIEFCKDARSGSLALSCGEDGTWFLEKPEASPFDSNVDIDTAIVNKEKERAARKSLASLAAHTEDDI